MRDPRFPYGRCECRDGAGSGCCRGEGPAAYEATRGGRTLRLCTRCDLSTDTTICLVRKEDDMALFLNFDPLGALCLALKCNEKPRGRFVKLDS